MKQRLIDANALIKEICSDCALFLDQTCDGERTSCYPSSIVRKQKTVDAVPVVRCKDCLWRHDDSSPMWLPCMERKTPNDWFCADGERRTDEHHGS